jgi:hypothetical protein
MLVSVLSTIYFAVKNFFSIRCVYVIDLMQRCPCAVRGQNFPTKSIGCATQFTGRSDVALFSEDLFSLGFGQQRYRVGASLTTAPTFKQNGGRWVYLYGFLLIELE